jgi:hypothetical protein
MKREKRIYMVAMFIGMALAFGFNIVIYGTRETLEYPVDEFVFHFSWIGWGVSMVIAGLIYTTPDN